MHKLQSYSLDYVTDKFLSQEREEEKKSCQIFQFNNGLYISSHENIVRDTFFLTGVSPTPPLHAPSYFNNINADFHFNAYSRIGPDYEVEEKQTSQGITFFLRYENSQHPAHISPITKYTVVPPSYMTGLATPLFDDALKCIKKISTKEDRKRVFVECGRRLHATDNNDENENPPIPSSVTAWMKQVCGSEEDEDKFLFESSAWVRKIGLAYFYVRCYQHMQRLMA